METTVNETSGIAAEPMRPQFLSVLCILTWVCAGLMFVASVWGILFQPSPEKQLEKIEEMRSVSPEMADKMEAALEKQGGTMQVVNTILSLIALALSAYGAYMMWQLKKTGFYLYLAGELLPYLGFV